MRVGIKCSIAKHIKRFAKAEKGAAAVEFALVAIPFFMLLGVILESGISMFAEYTLQASVQQAARLIRTGQAYGAGISEAAFKTEVCKTAGLLINCNGGVTVYVAADSDFLKLKTKVPSFLNVGMKDDGTPNPGSYAIGKRLETVAVVATYDWTFSMPFMSFMGNIAGGTKRRLVGFALFQNEPFPP